MCMPHHAADKVSIANFWVGVGMSKIRTLKGQNIESVFKMIRTSKIRMSKRTSKAGF